MKVSITPNLQSGHFASTMGKALASTMLSLIREVVFGVGFALILPLFWGLDGVLYSMPLSDFITFLIAAYLICRTYSELSQKDPDIFPVPVQKEK